MHGCQANTNGPWDPQFEKGLQVPGNIMHSKLIDRKAFKMTFMHVAGAIGKYVL